MFCESVIRIASGRLFQRRGAACENAAENTMNKSNILGTRAILDGLFDEANAMWSILHWVYRVPHLFTLSVEVRWFSGYDARLTIGWVVVPIPVTPLGKFGNFLYHILPVSS